MPRLFQRNGRHLQIFAKDARAAVQKIPKRLESAHTQSSGNSEMALHCLSTNQAARLLRDQVIDCSTNGTFLNGFRLPPKTTGKAASKGLQLVLNKR